jgi:hypothetical protein
VGERGAGYLSVGPMRVRWVGKTNVEYKKKFDFVRNTLQIAIFLLHSSSTIYNKKHMTDESGVRGNMGLNWVRKVFNCLGSLYYIN